jgi:CHAT domain-containing protein/tetratricopeptide (TPR) repeat protein
MNEQQRNAYQSFLSQVMQEIAQSGDNSQRVYPLLAANLDKLDENLITVLREWSKVAFILLGSKQAPGLALGISIFSEILQKFPLGSKASNLEIVIAGYEIAATIFTREEKPTVWAVIQNNLGLAYGDRIKGERSLNIEQALQCYQAALQVRTRDALPSDWAQTQMNLGNAYLNRIEGNRSENIEQAIQCYQAALQVYTRAVFPKEWADTHHNLGAAYKDRIKGEHSLNLEQAIACYEAALQVRTKEVSPQSWAETHNNLGIAYSHRICGERTQNLEKAIAVLQAALQIRTCEVLPYHWADTQINLGVAYFKRIHGERAENLEQASAHYQAALQVLTKEEFPQKWAAIQNNLGAVYDERIRGDRAENLEQAIRCHQAALQVYSREAFPFEWAQTQNNLGSVYFNRIRGERAENLEQAIQYYETALQVRTRQDFPQDWAMTQNNLGTAYLDRIRGDRAENLEQAIQHYQSALLVRTADALPQDWAVTQINLGNAYAHRIRGEESENLEQAIQCYQAALQVNTREAFPQRWAEIQSNLGVVYVNRLEGNEAENVEQAIHCCQAALQVRTREALPHFWAKTQVNLGRGYSCRIHGERTENMKAAIACYQAALQVYTSEALPYDWALVMHNLGYAYSKLRQTTEALPYFRSALEIYTTTAFPVECLRTGKNLGDTAFATGHWAEAIEGYGVAIKAVETSRSWASTEARRQEILEAEFLVYANMVQACVKNGEIGKAIEYVERSRCQRLVDLMASNDFYSDGEIPGKAQEYLQQYESLQQQINSYRQSQNSGNKRELMGIGSSTRDRAALKADNETIHSLEIQKQQVWEHIHRLDPVLAGQVQVSPLNLATIQQLIGHKTTAILSFFTTREDTHIFVVRQNQITCHSCLGQGGETLQTWIAQNWLLPYLTNKSEWKNQISLLLVELASRLQVNNLIAQHLSGIEELILVPHLYLHQIPFAALPIGNGQYLGDKFLIRYTPSCQVLEFCSNRPQLRSHLNYGTVEDATEDLPCASFEGEKIAQLYNIPEDRRLKGRTQATVSNYRQLAKQVQVLHSSHHAGSRLDNPLESKLYLGNGNITLGQLMTPGWRLPNLSDVFLSCCETSLGLTQITDDVLTLSSGFLCAGARNVVSTLWSVEDLATALFSICYHRYRQQGSCRSSALQQAQEELRSLSGQTLATVYQPQLTLLLDAKFQQAEKARKEAKANRDKETKGTQAYLKWDEEYKRHTKAAERIRKTKNRLNALCQESFPFSHPFYWAAFTCSGLR